MLWVSVPHHLDRSLDSCRSHCDAQRWAKQPVAKVPWQSQPIPLTTGRAGSATREGMLAEHRNEGAPAPGPGGAPPVLGSRFGGREFSGQESLLRWTIMILHFFPVRPTPGQLHCTWTANVHKSTAPASGTVLNGLARQLPLTVCVQGRCSNTRPRHHAPNSRNLLAAPSLPPWTLLP